MKGIKKKLKYFVSFPVTLHFKIVYLFFFSGISSSVSSFPYKTMNVQSDNGVH